VEKAGVIAGLLGLARWIMGALLLVWSIPVGLLTLRAYPRFDNGEPLWEHVLWLKVELALIALFVVATLSVGRFGRDERRRYYRARTPILAVALLLPTVAVGYLASIPIEERYCALRWWDGVTVSDCVLRMHQ
jgi:hypothetical protein